MWFNLGFDPLVDFLLKCIHVRRNDDFQMSRHNLLRVSPWCINLLCQILHVFEHRLKGTRENLCWSAGAILQLCHTNVKSVK